MSEQSQPAEEVIIVDNVSKIFRLPHERTTSIKGAIINFGRKRRTYEEQKALLDVSFKVRRGEFLGIVGRNGSGKSTLLKLLAGIYAPTKGHVHVRGKLTPFIELGVGFNPELTGRENVYLNGALLGFDRKDMDAMYGDIVSFAELEKFMDQKLKNYSSGMQVRLAFSIAIRAQSDILLIDEVLAVGDALFQQKCYDYFDKLKSSGRTVVFISHDMGAVQSFCDRAILINAGKLLKDGHPQEVVQRYNQLLADESPAPKRSSRDDLQHEGVGGVEITAGDIIDSKGNITSKIAEGEPFSIRIRYKADKKVDNPVVGIGIMGQLDQSILGPNSRESGVQIGRLKDKGFVEVHFPSNPLSTGTYRVRASIMNTSVTIPYDFIENLTSLTVIGKKRYGDIYVEPVWTIK
jgi:ABC-2 type transport system ATP-binding protein